MKLFVQNFSYYRLLSDTITVVSVNVVLFFGLIIILSMADCASIVHADNYVQGYVQVIEPVNDANTDSKA